MMDETEKYILTKEQLKILLREAILLNKLRNLAMDYSWMDKITKEEFEKYFYKTKEKLKLLNIDYTWDNKQRRIKLIISFNENEIETL